MSMFVIEYEIDVIKRCSTIIEIEIEIDKFINIYQCLNCRGRGVEPPQLFA
jgi:hypothetical protein